MQFYESCYTKLTLPHLASETARQLYYYVQWTGHFDCKADFIIQRANMKSFLLLYTLRGQGRLTYKGKAYSVPEKSVLLLDCTLPHEYTPDGPWEFKYIHFSGQSSPALYRHIMTLSGSPVLPNAAETERYFDTILLLVKNAGSEALCSEAIYRILTKLISLHDQTSDRFRIQEALNFIVERYASPISVPELADLAHMSRCYFSTQFKQATGLSPHAYLLHFRLHIARQLLYDTTDSIESIGARCGFSDASSFIRAFRKEEGVSPFVYRKKHQKPTG